MDRVSSLHLLLTVAYVIVVLFGSIHLLRPCIDQTSLPTFVSSTLVALKGLSRKGILLSLKCAEGFHLGLGEKVQVISVCRTGYAASPCREGLLNMSALIVNLCRHLFPLHVNFVFPQIRDPFSPSQCRSFEAWSTFLLQVDGGLFYSQSSMSHVGETKPSRSLRLT
ncbi:hypothetical protein K402DRAFT_269722 [Aulographum hederae CBS 113979]|uniref:Uncharacterized protein n=1 Tax=Aulographum hederae CBS 113979 TaxID=1176131 RepID=A0A6G1H835_9PEZI|nr:hypothetical protein K402DRAFT_269722 [Aulographum hederae CBS 113979]